MTETHILELPRCCPMSGNPQPGSTLEIAYRPAAVVLEVTALRAYVDSYIGGRGDVRSMEGMIQQITQEAANAVGECVSVRADLIINPAQQMRLFCEAIPEDRLGRVTCEACKVGTQK